MIVSDWPDLLPTHWVARPLRSVADYAVSNVDKVPAEDEVSIRLCNYSEVYNNEFITSKLDFMPCTATQEEITKFCLQIDDVIITKDSETWDDIGVPALVMETADDLVCGYHLALIRPHKGVLDGAFLLRCLQAKPLRVQLELAANGVTRFGLPKSAIGGMKLPVPPLAKQRSIAAYIQKEVSSIDGLVAAKRAVVDLLIEKRRSFIAHIVTKGLDPKARTRDSGTARFGDIPSHWQLKRAKWLFRERNERSVMGEEVLLSLRMERGLVPHNDVSEKTTVPGELVGYKKVSVGEIVLNRMRAASGLVAVASQDGLVSPDYAVFIASPEVDQEYYTYLFKTDLLQAVFRSESSGLGTGASGFLRLYSESFLALWFPYPPMNEQRAIVDQINSETARIDSLVTATNKSISLLKERRAAIIAAAVTGQINSEKRV